MQFDSARATSFPTRSGPIGQATQLAAASFLTPVLTVIPFAVPSVAPARSLLGEVLADQLTTALSATPHLQVISRLSSTQLAGRPQVLGDAPRLLGADYVLSGHCRIADKRLQVFAELADADFGHVVWARQFSGDSERRGYIVERLAREVGASLLREGMRHVCSDALDVLEDHTLLLGGIALMHRFRRADFERAKQALDVLIERSGHHPLPCAWLAKWHVLKIQQGWAADPAREAHIAADWSLRALDRNPGCALALAMNGLARTNLRDLDGALAQFRLALAENPNESLAWLLKAAAHAFRGEGVQALRDADRALALSPLDPASYYYDALAATAALSAADYGRALALGRRSLRANRMHTSTLRVIAIAQVQLGRMEAAREAARELLTLEPTFTNGAYLARHPAAGYPTGRLWAHSLQAAGVPA